MADGVMVARRGRRHRKRLRVVTCRGSSFTVDVSAGGFCTELMRVLPVGEPVEGLIHLNGRDVAFAGRVAWSRPGDPRLNERGRMGVCFVRIEPEFASSLEPRQENASAGGTHAGQGLHADSNSRRLPFAHERSLNAKEPP